MQPGRGGSRFGAAARLPGVAAGVTAVGFTGTPRAEKCARFSGGELLSAAEGSTYGSHQLDRMTDRPQKVASRTPCAIMSAGAGAALRVLTCRNGAAPAIG